MSSGTTGAISELIASSDLLKKGFEVFRSVSATCSCDLAVLKDSTLLRIEVRTARRMKNGTVAFLKNKTDGRADHYAAVLPDTSEVIYDPPLP